MKARTYDDIMRICFYRMGDDIDKREGSLAYITTSAFAAALADAYSNVKEVENNAFVITASGTYMDKAAAILGVERKAATKAIVRIEGDTGYNEGDVFYTSDCEYVVISVNDDYYLAECQTPGIKGNEYIGEVMAKVDKSSAIMSITKIISPGEDVEDDDTFRERYIEQLRNPVCAANIAYYRNAIKSFANVGGIRVVPVADGIGTVKVIITSSDYSVAPDELVKYVKETLDPEETSGQGTGLLPIGHSVTVESVEMVDIDIVLELEPASKTKGYLRQARTYLPVILKELNKTWDKQDRIVLRDRVIEDYFFGLGATDVNVISINGEPNRITLKENQLVGGVTINEKDNS
ncbi:MAG: baseplate J/gp47 family protein [Clostridia bacterium]